MDWLRSAIGLQAPPPSSKSNATLDRYRQTPHEERSEKFVRAQMMRIEMLKEELKDEESDTRAAVARGDRVAAQQHLTRAKKARLELQTLQKKHDNMMQTQGAILNAHSNVAQGLLVQESAAELESAVNALEEIDFKSAVDALQDAAAVMEEHDIRLTEPIFSNNVVEYEVEDELERLMQEHQEREALAATANLPSVHQLDTPMTLPRPQLEEIQETKN